LERNNGDDVDVVGCAYTHHYATKQVQSLLADVHYTAVHNNHNCVAETAVDCDEKTNISP
jgi:hypothetical protein